MKYDRIKLISTIISIGLLISLIVKVATIPGGMILPGFFLGGMVIVAILLGCLMFVGAIMLIFHNIPFLTFYSISTSICFLIFHYFLYSPTLKIVVPKGYTGEINLLLSNVEENILTIDTNGIGYVNEWTFEKTYTEPIVLESDGTQINNRCVGFNNSSFWGKSIGPSKYNPSYDGIRTMSFEIASEDTTEQKQSNFKDWRSFIDSSKLIKQ
jgi:hypothetical protein